jgi:hypothetical protein
MIRIFISYTSADSIFVDKLALDLASFHTQIFYDKWKIKVGDSIVEKINEALSSHDNLLIVLSKNSVKSSWVQRELNSSLMRQLKDNQIKIKPILIEDCDIPPLLADIKYADFRNDYNDGFTSLMNSFEEEIDLSRYIELIDSRLSDAELKYDKRMIAIMLKRLSPFPFACLSIISKIYNEGYIYDSQELYSEFISFQLQKLIDDNLLEKEIFEDKVIFKATDLGKIIFRLIFDGLNEGLIDAVCSH